MRQVLIHLNRCLVVSFMYPNLCAQQAGVNSCCDSTDSAYKCCYTSVIRGKKLVMPASNRCQSTAQLTGWFVAVHCDFGLSPLRYTLTLHHAQSHLSKIATNLDAQFTGQMTDCHPFLHCIHLVAVPLSVLHLCACSLQRTATQPAKSYTCRAQTQTRPQDLETHWLLSSSGYMQSLHCRVQTRCRACASLIANITTYTRMSGLACLADWDDMQQPARTNLKQAGD